jgi:hypothetical protein
MSSFFDAYIEDSSFSRLRYFVFFLLCGLLVFVIPRFLPGIFYPAFQLCLTAVFYLITLYTRKNNKYEKYSQISSAFFIASLVTFLDNLVYFFELTNDTTVTGMILTQILTSTLIIVPILILTKASRTNYSSIYLQRGKLKQGLIVGARAHRQDSIWSF